MSDVPLEAYLATVRADAHDTVRSLAAAVDAAGAVDQVDAPLVTAYVKEAVAKHDLV